ncbi:neuropeptide Y receptor type 2-like [Glandiceps talaboti]
MYYAAILRCNDYQLKTTRHPGNPSSPHYSKSRMNNTTDSPIEGINSWSAGKSFDNQLWLKLVYGAISVIGICGNSMVCFVVWKVKKMHTSTNYFIVSLAVADFITSVFLIPLHLGINIRIPAGVPGDMLCRLVMSKYPLWVSFTASVLNLTCVTLERYLAIVYPLKYHAFFTKNKAKLMIGAVWTAATLSMSFMLYVFYSRRGTCVLTWPSMAVRIVVGIIIFFVVYLGPLTVMAYSYRQMLSALKTETAPNNASAGISSHSSMEIVIARRRLIKLLLIIVTTFAICWTPNQFLYLAYSFYADVDFVSWYYHLTVLVAFCNSCMNPIIYAFKNRQYRLALKIAFGQNNMVGNQADFMMA